MPRVKGTEKKYDERKGDRHSPDRARPTIRINKYLKEEFDKHCKSRGLSFSDGVEFLIKEYLGKTESKTTAEQSILITGKKTIVISPALDKEQHEAIKSLLYIAEVKERVRYPFTFKSTYITVNLNVTDTFDAYETIKKLFDHNGWGYNCEETSYANNEIA